MARNSGKRVSNDASESSGTGPQSTLPRSTSTGSGIDVMDDLMDNMCKLLLVLAHADTAVKEQLCRLSTLKTYLGVVEVCRWC